MEGGAAETSASLAGLEDPAGWHRRPGTACQSRVDIRG